MYGLKCEKVLPQNGGTKKAGKCCKPNPGLEAWKKEMESIMKTPAKRAYKKGDLYAGKLGKDGKRILKG